MSTAPSTRFADFARLHTRLPPGADAGELTVCARWGSPGQASDDLMGVCRYCAVTVRCRPDRARKASTACVACAMDWVERRRGAAQ